MPPSARQMVSPPMCCVLCEHVFIGANWGGSGSTSFESRTEQFNTCALSHHVIVLVASVAVDHVDAEIGTAVLRSFQESRAKGGYVLFSSCSSNHRDLELHSRDLEYVTSYKPFAVGRGIHVNVPRCAFTAWLWRCHHVLRYTRASMVGTESAK